MRSTTIHKSNQVHQTAWIEDGAIIGQNNYFGPNCYIGSGVEIGHGNIFSGYCSIGMPAEHRDYFKKDGLVIIGDKNVIREFTTINGGTRSVTVLGDHNVMLRGSHVSHDTVVEDKVNLSCNVLIGGESRIMSGANLGLGAIVHQRTVVGSWAMLGMGCIGTKSTRFSPGNIFVGNPAKFLKVNLIGLERAGVLADELHHENLRYEQLVEQKRKGIL